MAVKKKSTQKSKPTQKSSPSSRQASAGGAAPGRAANPAGGRSTREAEPVDERAIARKNQKPRSARESIKGPSERKSSSSGKSPRR